MVSRTEWRHELEGQGREACREAKPAATLTVSPDGRPDKPRHPPLDRALFMFDGRLKELEELLYGHIIDAIALRRHGSRVAGAACRGEKRGLKVPAHP